MYMYNIYQKANNTLRDAEIYEKYHISQRGVSYRKLGGQYNLTGSRIQQIVSNVEKHLGIPPTDGVCITPLDRISGKSDNEDRAIIN